MRGPSGRPHRVVPRDNLPTVKRGNIYAVQVGGFRDPQTGEFAGGPLEVDFELLPLSS